LKSKNTKYSELKLRVIIGNLIFGFKNSRRSIINWCMKRRGREREF